MILCSDRNKISSNYSHKYSGIIKLCYYCSYICVCLKCRHLAEISIIFSSSFLTQKTHLTVQPLSLTARACFCRITAAFSFQFCSFNFAAAKESISWNCFTWLRKFVYASFLFPFFTGFSKGHFKASGVFLWHITHRFQSSSMFCGHKLKQIRNFYNNVYMLQCWLLIKTEFKLQ